MAEPADSNRTSLYYVEESTWGVTPSSPTMNEVQFTSIAGGHRKQTVVPTTVRSDRMQESLVRVGENAEMTFNFELRHTQYDTFLGALIAATGFTTITSTGNFSVDTATNKFTRASGSFVADGFVVGMWIKTSNFTNANNNGVFEIIGVTPTEITVASPTPDLVTETGTGDEVITAKMARNGTARRSFTIEQRFNDVGVFQAFTGMRVGQLDLTLNSRSIITGVWSFMGRQGVPSTTSVAGTLVPAASNPAFDTSNNVASIVEAGVPITTPILNASLTINNNIGVQPAIANRFPIGVRYGVLDITGRVEIYLQDTTLLNKFVNHTATSFVFKLQDDEGKRLFITLPRVQFSEGDTPVTGQNADVIVALPFQASRHVNAAGAAYEIQIDIFT